MAIDSSLQRMEINSLIHFYKYVRSHDIEKKTILSQKQQPFHFALAPSLIKWITKPRLFGTSFYSYIRRETIITRFVVRQNLIRKKCFEIYKTVTAKGNFIIK